MAQAMHELLDPVLAHTPLTGGEACVLVVVGLDYLHLCVTDRTLCFFSAIGPNMT